MWLTAGVLCWRWTVTCISLYFIGLTVRSGVARTDSVTSTDVMLQTTQLFLQQCPVEVQCKVKSTVTILQAWQLIAISKGFLLIVIGRDAQAGVPLAQYHLAAGAERCSVDSASALSCPLEARGEERGGVHAEHREGFRGSTERYFIKIGSYLA